MLLVLFITFVWLKIVAGNTLIFFWLWLAHDRDAAGRISPTHYVGVVVFWLGPWLLFLWHESSLYAGHCGFRQGQHGCGLVEFLWTQLNWVRLGLLLDASLFAGILFLMTRVRVIKSVGSPPGSMTLDQIDPTS